LLVDWVWGSGPGIANKFVQRYLNSKGHVLLVDGDFGKLSRAALNKEIAKRGEKAVYEDIYKIRYDFLDNLGKNTYPQFRTGWLNRMKDFYNMTINTIAENPGKTTIVGVLLVSGAIYLAWKYGSLDMFGNGANHIKKVTPIA
jgi:lysozyme family protein